MTDFVVRVGMDGWVNEDIPAQVNAATRGLKLDSTTDENKRAFLWFALPFSPGDDIDVSEAILHLHLKGAWASGPHTITAKRITEGWKSRTLNFDNQPTVGSTSGTVAVTGGAANDEVTIDVTDHLSEVASGTDAWYGLRLTMNTSGVLSLWAEAAFPASYRAYLTGTWTRKPDPPTDLSPAGGRIVSLAKPILGWHIGGARGETSQAKARVRTYSDAGITETFDSTLIALTETELDLSATAFSSLSDGEDCWWEVKYEDDQGRDSDFSSLAKFTRETQIDVTIDNPVDGATVEDCTPQILFSTSGGTLESSALFLDKRDSDGNWEEIYRRPRTVSTDLDITIPAGYIRRTDDDYRVRVRVWDDEDREWRPGDPTWAQAVAAFTYDRDASVDPVDTIVAQQHADGSPLVDIVFTTDDAPDYFALVVDGDRVDPRIDPADVVSGVGEYTIVYESAPALRDVEYMVERVQNVGGVLKHSKTDNPTSTYASTPIGIWLWNPDDPSAEVVLMGSDHGADFAWVENAGVFYPAGSGHDTAPVRLVQSTGGRAGTVRGVARDNNGTKARTYLVRLRKIWRTGQTMRLVMGEISVPVVIGEPSESPLPEFEPAYQVSFTVLQVGEFDRDF